MIYITTVALSCLNLSFDRCAYLTLPLRPVVGVLRSRTGRQFFTILKTILPEMCHSLVPLLVFLMVVVVCSMVIPFDGHNPNPISLQNPLLASYHWFFLVFTNDNFSDMLPPYLVHNFNYLLFFFPIIYVGQRFLLNIILGDTYDTYKVLVKKRLKKERLKELQGLTKAFKALDHDHSGTISSLVWSEAMHRYDPSLSEEAIALYFELIAQGADVINVIQFMSLRRVLSFRLTIKPKPVQRLLFPSLLLLSHVLDACSSAMLAVYSQKQISIPGSCRSAAQRVLGIVEGGGGGSTQLLLQWFILVSSADILLLCFDLLHVPVCSGSLLVVTAAAVMHALYVSEFLLRFVASDGRLDEVRGTGANWTSLLFVAGAISLLLLDASSIVVAAEVVSSSPATSLFAPTLTLPSTTRQLYLICHLLRCLRIRNLNKHLLSFSMAIVDVLPTLCETFTFTVIITYILGMTGHVLFGPYMEEWRTPLLGFVKALRLSYMVDFLQSLEEAMDKVHPTSLLFFLFLLLLQLAVSNIALSIIIEVQNSLLSGKTSSDRDRQRRKIEEIFQEKKDSARKRAAFSRKIRYDYRFNAIEISQFQSSDTRRFIADMDEEDGVDSSSSIVTLDELKKCQKYASIDLSDFYHRHKDLSWEMDFIQALLSCQVGRVKVFMLDDLVFDAGAAADALYVVFKGSLRLTTADADRQAKVDAINVVGSDCLHVEGKHQFRCEAIDDETKCIELTRAEVEKHLANNDLSGGGALLRLCFKSSAVISSNMTTTRSPSKKGRRLSSGGTLRLGLSQSTSQHSFSPSPQ